MTDTNARDYRLRYRATRDTTAWDGPPQDPTSNPVELRAGKPVLFANAPTARDYQDARLRSDNIVWVSTADFAPE